VRLGGGGIGGSAGSKSLVRLRDVRETDFGPQRGFFLLFFPPGCQVKPLTQAIGKLSFHMPVTTFHHFNFNLPHYSPHHIPSLLRVFSPHFYLCPFSSHCCPTTSSIYFDSVQYIGQFCLGLYLKNISTSNVPQPTVLLQPEQRSRKVTHTLVVSNFRKVCVNPSYLPLVYLY